MQGRLVAAGVTVSWADLIQLGGVAGVLRTGGPLMDVTMGRKWVPFIHAAV